MTARLLGRAAVALLLTSLALGAAADAAAAAAPPNDNYLASTQMVRSDGTVARTFHDQVDASAATVQPDLFNPDRYGMPFGGGKPENTTCGQTQFGATVWYDFAPEISGGAEIITAGYDTVVTVYQYDVRTASITATLTCANKPAGGEDVLLPHVKAGVHYTIQVGGVAAAGGPLDFTFSFYGDRDEDEVLDLNDKCPAVPGVSEAGGCPPQLRTAIRTPYLTAPGGLRLQTLSLTSVPIGARIRAVCHHCGSSQTVVARRSTARLSRFAGRFMPDGATLEVFVTRATTSSGRYRHGAIGNYYRYSVRNSRLTPRVDRCIKPGSTTPRKRCT